MASAESVSALLGVAWVLWCSEVGVWGWEGKGRPALPNCRSSTTARTPELFDITLFCVVRGVDW